MNEYDEIYEHWGGPDCPMDATLELIGRKWVVAIIRDMYVGKKHFSQFKQNKPNLTNSVLSDTLKFMVEKNLIEKVVNDDGTRNNTEYHLKDKARKLNKIIYTMIEYGLDELGCCDNMPEVKSNMKKAYQELFKIEE